MKSKILLSALLLFLCAVLTSVSTKASSAYPYPVTITQRDHSIIQVIMQGDEHLKSARTMDGYTLVYNRNGIFEYAKTDASGDLVASGIKAKNIAERTRSETAFLNSIAKGLAFSESQVSLMKQISRGGGPTTQAFPTTGNRKLICILIGYTDLAFTKTQTDFQNLFNQVAYSTDGAAGSVHDFFYEDSYSQLNLTVDVAGPYTVSDTRAHYGANDASGNDLRPREMVTEAVNLADADVNYADYDNDGDGTVDGVYVIYAGHGEEAGGGADAIWAHAWSIPAVTLDGKTISKYSTSAELRGSSGTGITRIGVICHEFGHVLGEKDFYDVDYATGGQYNGNGHWDLMAGGNWNNNGITPAHNNPYSKAYTYNWATVTTLSAQGTVTIPSAHATAAFYRFNTATANEYYIMENRQQLGFDASVPGHGLLIFHAHADLASHIGPNNINATGPQYFYPVCASATTEPGLTPASYGSNDGDGTTYPGSSNKTQFTDATIPSQKSWSGTATNKPIAFITEDNAAHTVTFCYLGCAPVADFSAGNTTPCTGDAVNFTDASTYSPTLWAWSFSPATVTYTGGTSASSQNPSVQFNAAGNYSVTLTASNAYGNSTPEVKTNYINVSAKPAITLQPLSQVKQWGDNVSFTSAASGTPAATVQWQVSTDAGSTWTDIGGATSATLALSCITLAQNGYQYHAVFTNICGSTVSAAATLSVNPRVVTGTVTIVPNPQQYSDPVALNVVLTNAVACGEQAATSVTFYIGTQLMGTATLTVNGTNLEGSLPAVLVEPSPFGTAPTGQMSPGVHTVTAVFNGVNPDFNVTNATSPLTINPEDARTYYTGACYASTVSATSSNAIITLAATIKDITAVTGDPAYDSYPGDLRNATITFINRDNNTIIAANVPLGLVNPNDTKVAVATYNWNVTITGDAQSFTVGIIIGGYYTRNSSEDNTVVTVAKPLSDFVSGGGYLVLSSSGGIKAGDTGSKSNFGFSVKFNKRGTNLHGSYNNIIRRTELGVQHVYQVKGNNFTSLAIQKSLVGGNATFNSKANIVDITNPLSPVSIAGNCALQVKMMDHGQPGNNDSISLTLWNSSGGLWYASNWNGTRTIEQVLANGNLQVNSNNSFKFTDEDIYNEPSSLSIYPNPTHGQFTVIFNSTDSKPCVAKLIDNMGRETLSEIIQANAGENKIDYDLNTLADGIYYFILDVDDNHEVYKVMVSNK